MGEPQALSGGFGGGHGVSGTRSILPAVTERDFFGSQALSPWCVR